MGAVYCFLSIFDLQLIIYDITEYMANSVISEHIASTGIVNRLPIASQTFHRTPGNKGNRDNLG